MTPIKFFTKAIPLAIESGHIWPEIAVCEAALESGWAESQLTQLGNNLFGQKQHQHPDHGFIILPTREYIDNKWVVVKAEFEKFDSWTESFTCRMDTLRRLAPHYEHYAKALTSTTAREYITEVSRTWATDPDRADAVMRIYNTHLHDIANAFALVAVDLDGSV